MKTWALSLFLLLCLHPALAQPEPRINLSEPIRFASVHGRRAWAGGYSGTGLEIWAGELQIATAVRPEFRRANTITPITGAATIAKVVADPSHLSRTYTGPGFAVDEEVWVAPDESAVLVQYAVHSATPLQVVVRFLPSLNLMWPAAVGGQEIRWDENESGYVLTEPKRQFAAVVLAPGSTAHDEVLNIARPLNGGDELAVALDSKSPQILFSRIRGTAQLHVGIAHARELLSSPTWKEREIKHYGQIMGSELQIETPDAEVTRALGWAESALDQDWLCNELLGCAFVAGFGPSRRNRRPQYAWFFAGDGIVGMHGALAAGDLEHAREELRFIAKYQDPTTGMIWHELTQSAPYINWRSDYPYMFVHADVSYPYISAVADFVRRSNDRAFLQEIWPSVRKAFEYGRSLIASDGLPRVPAGKEGANEQTPLAEEIGLSANWVTACADYAHLAERVHDSEAAANASRLAEKARSSFAKRYWDAQRKFPIEGYQVDGRPVQDRGLGALGAVNMRLFTDSQVNLVLDQIASWRFQTDWGTRSVPIDAPGYDATAYAHGSVWALGTAEVATAYWAAHRPTTAWQVWQTLVPWATLDSPGHMHEVLAGDAFQPQVESVPEQTWSSASFLSAAVRGLIGLDVDAERNVVTLAPHVPPEWPRVAFRQKIFGDATVKFVMEQHLDSVTLNVDNSGQPFRLAFHPAVPLGSQNLKATANGRIVPVRVEEHREDKHAVVDLEVPRGVSELTIRYQGGVAVIVPVTRPSPGAASYGMKVTSTELEGDTLHLGIDLMPNAANSVLIRTRRGIRTATHGEVKRVDADTYEVKIVPSVRNGVDEYQHEVVDVVF